MSQIYPVIFEESFDKTKLVVRKSTGGQHYNVCYIYPNGEESALNLFLNKYLETKIENNNTIDKVKMELILNLKDAQEFTINNMIKNIIEDIKDSIKKDINIDKFHTPNTLHQEGRYSIYLQHYKNTLSTSISVQSTKANSGEVVNLDKYPQCEIPVIINSILPIKSQKKTEKRLFWHVCKYVLCFKAFVVGVENSVCVIQIYAKNMDVKYNLSKPTLSINDKLYKQTKQKNIESITI